MTALQAPLSALQIRPRVNLVSAASFKTLSPAPIDAGKRVTRAITQQLKHLASVSKPLSVAASVPRGENKGKKGSVKQAPFWSAASAVCAFLTSAQLCLLFATATNLSHRQPFAPSFLLSSHAFGGALRRWRDVLLPLIRPKVRSNRFIGAKYIQARGADQAPFPCEVTRPKASRKFTAGLSNFRFCCLTFLPHVLTVPSRLPACLHFFAPSPPLGNGSNLADSTHSLALCFDFELNIASPFRLLRARPQRPIQQRFPPQRRVGQQRLLLRLLRPRPAYQHRVR